MLFWLNELSIEKSYNDLLAITAYAAGSKYFGTAGRVRKKGIHTYILLRLYIPGQFSCNVFYITILIILQNKAVVVCGAQKKKEGFWCHSEELCYTVCGSIGSALQAQKEALPVQKSSSQNK